MQKWLNAHFTQAGGYCVRFKFSGKGRYVGLDTDITTIEQAAEIADRIRISIVGRGDFSQAGPLNFKWEIKDGKLKRGEVSR